MTDPQIGDDGLVFEDRPLPQTVLQAIPTEVGLWKTTVAYTCLDANEDYIVIGSEQGVVWVVDLESCKLIREYNEFRGVEITSVKLCPTRDLLAYGTSDGHVRVEKITLPMTNKWRVQEKDRQAVSALEWRGDELFCGFDLGRVIRIQLNIHDGTLSPLTFPGSYGSPVTQLSSRDDSLLISTVERTWIVDTQTHKLEQVGRKDRKPGSYGGCLVQGGERAYVARPGLRLWLADNTGKVLRTVVYKETLSSQHLPRVPLHSWSSLIPSYNKAWQFSTVLPWVGEHFIVTLSDHTLFILDPEKGLTVGVLSLGHPITDLSVTRGFVYLLCNDLKKPVCRISVKRSFLRALKRTLPVSPAHLPRPSQQVVAPPPQTTPQTNSSLVAPARTDIIDKRSEDQDLQGDQPSLKEEGSGEDMTELTADKQVPYTEKSDESAPSESTETQVIATSQHIHDSPTAQSHSLQPELSDATSSHPEHTEEVVLHDNGVDFHVNVSEVPAVTSNSLCEYDDDDTESVDGMALDHEVNDSISQDQSVTEESLVVDAIQTVGEPAIPSDHLETPSSLETEPTDTDHNTSLADMVDTATTSDTPLAEGDGSETQHDAESEVASEEVANSKTEHIEKTGGGNEPTLQEALSTVKAEMKELFKPKFDKLSNIFKVNTPGSLSPGRLRVLATKRGAKENIEEAKSDEESLNLEIHIEEDMVTPSQTPVANQKEEKTEQEAKKPDLKEILKLGRISNLLHKDSSGSIGTPGTPSVSAAPVLITPAPLDPEEQQRRLRMSQTNQREDEDEVVVVKKTKKKRRRKHKKLSSATSSVSVSLEKLTEVDEECYDSLTPLSAIATPITGSPTRPFTLTEEQKAKLELLEIERNEESKSVEREQTVLESLPESLPESQTVQEETEGDQAPSMPLQDEPGEASPEPSNDTSLAQPAEVTDTPVVEEVCVSETDGAIAPPIIEQPRDQADDTPLFDDVNSLDPLFEEEPLEPSLSKSHSPGLADSVAGSHEKSTTTTLGDLSDNPLYHDSDHEQEHQQEVASSYPTRTQHTTASPTKGLLSSASVGSRARVTVPRYQSSRLEPADVDPLQSDESIEGCFGKEDSDKLVDSTPVNLRPRLLSDSPFVRKYGRRPRPVPIVSSGSWGGPHLPNREAREASAEDSDSSREGEEDDDDFNLMDSQVVPDFYQLCGDLVRHSNQRKEAKASAAPRFSWANSTFQRQSIIESGDEEEGDEGSSSNADIWVPIPHPGRSHIQFICLSDILLWIVDSRGSVFCTTTASKGRDWQLIKKPMNQVCSSPSGKIVWGVHHRNAYVRLGIGLNPAGSTWKNATKGTFMSRKIKRVAVAENGVWAITIDNKTIFRKGVEESSPEGRVWQEVSGEGFTHISCCRNIVWAHTSLGKVFIREGITPSMPSGKKWMECKCPKLTASCLTSAGVAWGINSEGSIGFRCGISTAKPSGKGPWWEVKINALTHPSSPYNSLWQVMGSEGSHLLTSVSNMLPHISNQSKPVVLSASSQAGVIILQDSNRLHACWRTATGYHYKPASKNGLFPLTVWSNIASGGTGLWLVRDDGDLYCLTSDDKLKRVECPAAVSNLAASSTCLWIVADNLVWSRQGLCQEYPEGVSFDYIEVSPLLHERKIRHIVCGKTAVWALDQTGVPHFRFGVHSREPGTGMSPAWIPVEDNASPLLQISVSPDNWLVWACDEKYNAYVRTGVTHDFPIGRNWELVPNEQIKEVCVANDKVYGLTPNGELLCRYGVSEENVQGNYWRRMPGRYEHLASGMLGELWTLDSKGQVWKQEWKILTVSQDPKSGQVDFERSMIVDQSWEVV